MRIQPLFASSAIALALSACTQPSAPSDTASSNPGVVATTNAKVEPVPGAGASALSPRPSNSESAMPAKPSDDAALTACGADRAQSFIGRQDRPTTRADLAKLVGHDNIRWLGPDDAMTMDFSEGRLNVMLDAQKRTIAGVKCG